MLDRATYDPVVFTAWKALTECVTDDGMLGYVQPVGAATGDSFADPTEVYGIGAFFWPPVRAPSLWGYPQ